MRKDEFPIVYAYVKSVLEDIKAELWMEGMNMTGEYQGVWVRFKAIEKIIDNHISEKEQQGEQE